MLSIPSLYRVFLIRDFARDDVLVELPLVAALGRRYCRSQAVLRHLNAHHAGCLGWVAKPMPRFCRYRVVRTKLRIQAEIRRLAKPSYSAA